MKNETTILINEAKRAWSFPALPLPEEQTKLDERGKPFRKGDRELLSAKGEERAALIERQRRVTELEPVKRHRPPMLEAGGRIEVPNWYLRDLLANKFWKKILGRRDDGIAIGMTHADRLRRSQDEALAATRANAQEAQGRVSHAERRAELLEGDVRVAEKRAADLEAELARVRTELEKAEKKSADKAEKKTETRNG